jgi:hypothetical protein
VISTDSLFFIKDIILEKITHVIHQKINPHINMVKNDNIQVDILLKFILLPEVIIHNTTKNNAKAVQSLNKLSHSKIVTSLFGAQIDLKSESTATVSVAEIRLQYNKQIKYGTLNPIKGSKKYNRPDIEIAEIITQKIDNENIEGQLLNKSL